MSTRGVKGWLGDLLGKSSTHPHQVNALIRRALERSDVPVNKEPTGLLRDDGKRPGGHTPVPRDQFGFHHGGFSCNVLYLSSTSALPGSAIEAAVVREKIEVCRHHADRDLRSGSGENVWISQRRRSQFTGDQIGDRLSAVTGDPRECRRQRLSVLVQRFDTDSFRRQMLKISPFRLCFYLCFLSLTNLYFRAPRVQTYVHIVGDCVGTWCHLNKADISYRLTAWV